MRNFKEKKVVVSIILFISLIIISVGGKIYMDNKKMENEMLNVVKSGQAKEEIELSLKNLDVKALTSEGKIKSYEVDYSSVEHNPMGAIMFNVIVNNDSSLIANFDLNKHSGVLEVGGIGLSEKLSDMLRN